MKRDQTTILSPLELFEEAKKIKVISIDRAVEMAQEAYKAARKNNDFELEFCIHMFLGRTFRLQGEAFSSMEQLNKAYRILNQRFPKDKIKLSGVYREYGSLYSDYFNDHAVALDYFQKGLSFNNPEIIVALHNNIGCQYVMLEEYEKANFYLEKGLDLGYKKEDYLTLSFLYENFGTMYSQEGKVEEAIKSFDLGVEMAEKASDITSDQQVVNYIHCYSLIGLAKIYLKEKEIEKVKELVEKVYEKSNQFKLQSCWSESALIEGSLFLKNNNIDSFTALFEKAIQFCTENGLHSDKENWLHKMIKLCEQKEDYKAALNYSKKLIDNRVDRESKTRAVNVAKVLENKEMEILALEHQNREMKMQKDQLEQFAYIVAHDLKTPLSNISNFIGLFSKNYSDKVDEQNKYYLDFVLDNSKQLHRMFDELLKFIKVEEVKNIRSICNIPTMISKVHKKYALELVARNAELKLSTDSITMVKVNMHHLKTLLERMIENSIKFAQTDRDLKILIEVNEDLENYFFKISDNGIGIKEDYRKKIFALFKQLDKVNYEGIGMGLAICKKTINLYGGTILVTDNEWKGTTFEFNIPKDKDIIPSSQK